MARARAMSCPSLGDGAAAEVAECVLEDVVSFDPPVGAGRGGGEIGYA